MIFNFWRPYLLFKPKKSGHYLCTVRCGDETNNTGVMELYYTDWKNEFSDYRRVNVFEGYKVYKASKAAIEDNRVYSDSLCDRTLGVVAWKKLPKPCGWWRKKKGGE